MTERDKRPQVQSTVKDENLIAIRREQMIEGAIKLFKEKVFIVLPREKSQKLQALVSEHYMNIFVLRKMSFILYVIVFITMRWSDFQVMRLRQEL